MPRRSPCAFFFLAGLSLVACRKNPDPTLVYVSAESSGEIVVVDPDHGSVVARVAVGKRPRGLVVSPDGRLLYVALSGSPRGGPHVDES
jgi:YVTN family beta-propeller protein